MSANIHFFLEDIHYRIRRIRALQKWIQTSIEQEQLVAGNINIILCSDDYLHQKNVQYLNHDSLTDIITFDYSEESAVHGDLFISLDRVKDNSVDRKLRLDEELHRVIIHGVLHLCGYMDKSLKDSDIMTNKEDFYLSLRPF